MAISTRNTSFAAQNLRYSAFLGMLYVSTPEVEQAIKDAKAAIGGEEVVKKGFQGTGSNSPSGQAIKILADQGIGPVSVAGRLTSARIVMREISGRETPYLNIGIHDEGQFYISVELGQSSAQMLVRKLANAAPGVFTEISMFATYGARPGAQRAYANHGASLKQSDQEVKGVDPNIVLRPSIDSAMKALQDAGLDRSRDSKTFYARRDSVELEFHQKLMSEVNQKFTDHYAATEQPAPDSEFAPANSVPAGLDDFDDRTAY